MTGYLGAYAQRTKHLFDYNVIEPKIETINGRRYRVNPTWPSSYEEKDPEIKCKGYDDVACQPYVEDDGGASEDEDLDIQVGKSGQFTLQYHAPKAFFPFIIGTKGATKRRVETETNTQLHIPRQGDKGDIVISGYSQKGVASAKHRLDVILLYARKKVPYTHFLSIPVCNPSIHENFIKFKSEVISNFSHCRGVEESLFIAPSRLHITMGMLTLADSTERDHAVDVLQKCANDIILPILRSQRITIRIQGLDYMNDDPKEIHILYGVVHDDNGLVQKLCDDTVDYFIREGLIDKNYQKYKTVKMHVTLMNTKWRKNSIENDKRIPFDCSEILKAFSNYDFGQTFVYSVHLSQRHTKDIDGYFKSSAVISL